MADSATERARRRRYIDEECGTTTTSTMTTSERRGVREEDEIAGGRVRLAERIGLKERTTERCTRRDRQGNEENDSRRADEGGDVTVRLSDVEEERREQRGSRFQYT